MLKFYDGQKLYRKHFIGNSSICTLTSQNQTENVENTIGKHHYFQQSQTPKSGEPTSMIWEFCSMYWDPPPFPVPAPLERITSWFFLDLTGQDNGLMMTDITLMMTMTLMVLVKMLIIKMVHEDGDDGDDDKEQLLLNIDLTISSSHQSSHSNVTTIITIIEYYQSSHLPMLTNLNVITVVNTQLSLTHSTSLNIQISCWLLTIAVTTVGNDYWSLLITIDHYRSLLITTDD